MYQFKIKPQARVNYSHTGMPVSPDINKVGAIKTYRFLTGQGLKEAKDAVERAMDGVWTSLPVHETFVYGSGRSVWNLIDDLGSHGFEVYQQVEDREKESLDDLIHRAAQRALDERHYDLAGDLIDWLNG